MTDTEKKTEAMDILLEIARDKRYLGMYLHGARAATENEKTKQICDIAISAITGMLERIDKFIEMND